MSYKRACLGNAIAERFYDIKNRDISLPWCRKGGWFNNENGWIPWILQYSKNLSSRPDPDGVSELSLISCLADVTTEDR